MAFPAQYAGTCKCGLPIDIGQAISNYQGTWVHEECAKELAPQTSIKGSFWEQEGKRFAPRIDPGKHLNVDGTAKGTPARKAKRDVVIPVIMDACSECQIVDGTVLFGYCDGCQQKWQSQKEAI